MTERPLSRHLTREVKRPRGLRISTGATVVNCPGYPEVVSFGPGDMMSGDMRQKIDAGLRDGRCTVTFEPLGE